MFSLLGILVLAVPALAETPDLPRINQALQHWLDLIDADQPYLLIDRQRAEVRLMHGRAVLRLCPVQQDRLGAAPALHTQIDQHLRRYRLAGPDAVRQSGVFDWEQNLAEHATPQSALYGASGLLLYGADSWDAVAGPAVKLDIEDAQALYNTCSAGMEVVVLPPQWEGK